MCIDVEYTAEADGDGSHLAATSVEQREETKSRGRESGKRERRSGERRASGEVGVHVRKALFPGGGRFLCLLLEMASAGLGDGRELPKIKVLLPKNHN